MTYGRDDESSTDDSDNDDEDEDDNDDEDEDGDFKAKDNESDPEDHNLDHLTPQKTSSKLSKFKDSAELPSHIVAAMAAATGDTPTKVTKEETKPKAHQSEKKRELDPVYDKYQAPLYCLHPPADKKDVSLTMVEIVGGKGVKANERIDPKFNYSHVTTFIIRIRFVS